MKLLFCADMAVTIPNEDLFVNGEIEKIIDEEMRGYLEKFDFRVINIEMALTETDEPIVKCGPNIKASKKAINAIKKFKPSLALLSNNHTLDFGEVGLRDTIDVLSENNIPYIGAGENVTASRKPYIFEKDGKKVGIYDCCEHEFTIAGKSSWGANPYEPLYTFNDIAELKKKCDYVVVIYHGGKEYYRYPSPELQKKCRKMIDSGADAVMCQHSHCIGCFEDYNDGKIIYGLGNFVFVDDFDLEAVHTSLIVGVEVADGLKFEYYPICMSDTGSRTANEAEAKEILDNFYARSEEIKRPGVVEKKYSEFAATKIDEYLKKMQRVYDKDGNCDMEMITAMFNYFTCEAHVEVVAQGLYDMFKNEKPYWNYLEDGTLWKL